MSLAAGARLAQYEILEPIGKGGMGEVYRARDGKLGRGIALKVLPEAFSKDQERLARFEREARLLASLNHPNISVLHGFEESDGVHFLVMELVEGETLADRIARGPIPLDDALHLFRQIAEALEAAHGKGVIHRDLKPANIKITPEGKIKVLDFGLAKSFEGEVSDVDLSQSPTRIRDGTQAGVILGTAPYMSPEQARGKAVDKRADIWAFGCVLFEALTGRLAFPGETLSDTIVMVLSREPAWERLPGATPPGIRFLLRRCLQKDPQRRLRDAWDARLEIEDVLAHPQLETNSLSASPPTRSRVRAALPLVIGATVLVGSIAGMAGFNLKRSPQSKVARLGMLLPENQPVTGQGGYQVPLSPDGSRLVYQSRGQLYSRAMDQMEAVPIRGAEGIQPFFSPGGDWVGFLAEDQLKKVSVDGGAPVLLCEAGIKVLGASWGQDDSIVFGLGAEGIWQVSANGGTPEILVGVDAEKGEHASLPWFMPGGKSVLFTLAVGLDWNGASIVSYEIESGKRQVLIEGGSDARYVPTGHLVYAVGTTVLAVPFDLDRMVVTGGPVPVIEDVQRVLTEGAARFSFSDSGNLAYVPGSTDPLKKLFWVDRDGNATPMSDKPGMYRMPRVSPDGERLSVKIAENARTDVWIYEIGRDLFTPLTTEGNNTGDTAWSPDGEWLAFTSDLDGEPDLYRRRTDFSSPAERILAREYRQTFASWSSEAILYTEIHTETGGDLWVLPFESDEDEEPRPFVRTPSYEGFPDFSPNGRWIAYLSGETGQAEIYVQPYPGPGRRWRISSDGGGTPRWSSNGRELFYAYDDRLWVVDVTSEEEFTVGTPRALFGGVRFDNWDVAPDGKRFVMVKPDEDAARLEGRQIHVVLNWFQELERLVPTQ